MKGNPHRYAKMLSTHIENEVWAETNSDSESLSENLSSAALQERHAANGFVSAQTSPLIRAEINVADLERDTAVVYDHKPTLPNDRPPLEAAQVRRVGQQAAGQ